MLLPALEFGNVSDAAAQHRAGGDVRRRPHRARHLQLLRALADGDGLPDARMDIGRFPRDQRADRLHLGAAQRGQVARAACRHAGRSRMTVSRRTMLKGGLAAGAAMAAPAVASEGTASTERWGVLELGFDGPAKARKSNSL